MEKRYGDDGSYYVFLYDDSVNADMDILCVPGEEPVIECSNHATANAIMEQLENIFCYV